jgi:hypothetical protein
MDSMFHSWGKEIDIQGFMCLILVWGMIVYLIFVGFAAYVEVNN